MSLQEFDALIDKMRLAFEYAQNLGQYVDAAKILYQMNQELPESYQITLEELDNSEAAKPFITQHESELRSAITQYRQKLMNP